ncbi:hypothetical protein OG874_03480 [Nocardia sp. NBC_00565]|uniref:hypothetical protein n=1 Tax=Nocardia sp. NBC_00565 TaxID=2975993 RepID=UPI002E806995|nr:hypothetical protein [Nocardia sp. NBC_00565]WUC04280.1 hypothetical protein OG874_03480 [Nocardia sp. NBC_00565]
MSTQIGDWLNENTVGFNDQKKPDNRLIADGTDYRDEYFQETAFLWHDVGLKQDDETKLPGFLSGTIAGDAWEAYANLRNGKTFESITGGVAVGVTVADAFYDPFGFVGDQIAGWMLTHVEPYRKTLDALAGNDEMVQAYSDTWTNIANELTSMSEGWQKGVEADIATWTGSAGDAYRSRATDLIDQIAGAGGVAASLGETMALVSKIVKVFRKLVQDILTSLAGALIGYTIEIACTLGGGIPHVITAAVGRMARDGFKISALLTEMAAAFKDVHTLVQAVTAVIYALLGKENQPTQA